MESVWTWVVMGVCVLVAPVVWPVIGALSRGRSLDPSDRPRGRRR